MLSLHNDQVKILEFNFYFFFLIISPLGGKQNMQTITGGLIQTIYLLLSNRCHTLLLTGLWVKMLLGTKLNVTFS